MSADAMIVRCAPGSVPRGTLYEAGMIHGAWEANRHRLGHANGMPIVWLLVDGAPLPCIFARWADAVMSAGGHGPESRAVLRRLGQSRHTPHGSRLSGCGICSSCSLAAAAVATIARTTTIA